MKKENKTFVFDLEWVEILSDYPSELRHQVYDAIMHYASTGEEIELEPLARMAFSFIKKKLDENLSKWIATLEKRSEAGKAGMKKRWEDNKNNKAIEPITNMTNITSDNKNNKAISEKQPITNITDNDCDCVSEYDNDNVSLSSFEKGENSPIEAQGREREKFFEYLFFEKAIREPQHEADRFIAHYEKTGWIDKNGNRVVDKMAALRGWRPDQEAKKVTAKHLPKWHSWYAVAKMLQLDGYQCMITDLVNLTVNDTSTVITCRENLHHFIEMWASDEDFKRAYREHFGSRNVVYKPLPKE